MTATYPRLETERLVLTSFRAEDTDARHAYQGRADVAQYLYRQPLSREDCSEGIAQAETRWNEDGSPLLLAVRTSEGAAPIGEIVLTCSDRRAQQFEIGWVFNPVVSGKGYATEAARAVAGFAFAEVGAHRLFARLDTLNERSVALCERLGFRREAHLLENDRLPSGEWGSEFVYAALESDLHDARAAWR